VERDFRGLGFLGRKPSEEKGLGNESTSDFAKKFNDDDSDLDSISASPKPRISKD
jgi:hypothetical protein